MGIWNSELGTGCLILDTGCHPEGIFAVAGKILVLDVVYWILVDKNMFLP